MGSFAHAVGWAAYLINLVWTLWFGIGVVVGGILLARDEWRLYRTRPRPEEVKAYANDLVVRHGCEAFRINEDAMVAARNAKQFDCYRFLKEVSGELVRQLFGRHEDRSSPTLTSGESPAENHHRRASPVFPRHPQKIAKRSA